MEPTNECDRLAQELTVAMTSVETVWSQEGTVSPQFAEARRIYHEARNRFHHLLIEAGDESGAFASLEEADMQLLQRLRAHDAEEIAQVKRDAETALRENPPEAPRRAVVRTIREEALSLKICANAYRSLSTLYSGSEPVSESTMFTSLQRIILAALAWRNATEDEREAVAATFGQGGTSMRAKPAEWERFMARYGHELCELATDRSDHNTENWRVMCRTFRQNPPIAFMARESDEMA